MTTAKIAITLDDLSAQTNQQCLEAECAKLDPQKEQEFSELGIEEFLNIPEISKDLVLKPD
jgi:hypothetical protein